MKKSNIIFRIAVAFLCLLSLIMLTFSWFNRGDSSEEEISGNSMRYQDAIMSSADGIDMATYAVKEYTSSGKPAYDSENNIEFDTSPVNVSDYTVPENIFLP
ncbi:MAG: hypothetical protein ACI4QE_05540, partial [Acutalibacteraceae bacterium]